MDPATFEPTVQIRDGVVGSRVAEAVTAIKAAHFAMDATGKTLADTPLPMVRWVLSKDFEADVRAFLSADADASFHADRVGGRVAAKTMSDANGGYVIFVNGEFLADGEAQAETPTLVFLMLHELAHVLQYATREGSTYEHSSSPGSIGRALHNTARYAIDEWRADDLAYFLLPHLAVVTDIETGQPTPASAVHTDNIGYLATMEDVTRQLYPRLRDRVQDYRIHHISLEQLVDELVTETFSLVVFVAHWHALCQALGAEDPWAIGDLSSPAVNLYLRPMWTPILEAINALPKIPSRVDAAAGEPELLDAAVEAIQLFLAALGIAIDHLGGMQEYVHVDAPS